MRAERHSAQEQYKLIMECRSSGMTDYQWCIANGIKPGTVHSWVMRLKSKYHFDIPQRQGRTDLAPAPKQDIVRVDIVDEDAGVKLRNTNVNGSSHPASQVSAIEIHTSGMNIKVSNQADPELVSLVLRTIGGSLC